MQYYLILSPNYFLVCNKRRNDKTKFFHEENYLLYLLHHLLKWFWHPICCVASQELHQNLPEVGAWCPRRGGQLNLYILRISITNMLDKYSIQRQTKPLLLSVSGLTVGSKIIWALAIILVIFLWFDCQFLSSHASN